MDKVFIPVSRLGTVYHECAALSADIARQKLIRTVSEDYDEPEEYIENFGIKVAEFTLA